VCIVFRENTWSLTKSVNRHDIFLAHSLRFVSLDGANINIQIPYYTKEIHHKRIITPESLTAAVLVPYYSHPLSAPLGSRSTSSLHPFSY
jgi:hypothetical protein